VSAAEVGCTKMKLSDLKKLIREELESQGTERSKQGESEAPVGSSALQKAGIGAFRTLGGVQANETDIVELLINLIQLAKQKNINTPALRRALTMVKKAAEQIKE